MPTGLSQLRTFILVPINMPPVTIGKRRQVFISRSDGGKLSDILLCLSTAAVRMVTQVEFFFVVKRCLYVDG